MKRLTDQQINDAAYGYAGNADNRDEIVTLFIAGADFVNDYNPQDHCNHKYYDKPETIAFTSQSHQPIIRMFKTCEYCGFQPKI